MIALLPKSEVRLRAQNYRPISLLNTLYKVIAKQVESITTFLDPSLADMIRTQQMHSRQHFSSI